MGKKIHRTMIGGQAVIEGVMMRGVDKVSLAVRKPDGTIDLEVWPASSIADKHSPRRIPIIRGVINFVESLVYGYKTLSQSAEIAGIDDDDEKPSAGKESGNADESTGNASESTQSGSAEENAKSASDSKENKGNAGGEKDDKNSGGIGDVAMSAMTVASLILGFVLAMVLFVILPTFIVGKTEQFIHWGNFKTIVEGVIKIAIFIVYLALISRMKDIRRVYEYHGAEHKTIYCYEHGDELTPENARKYTRFHPRCGTSFLLIVLIVSILVFSFVTWKTLWLRIILKLALLPVVVGISYEIIKFAGRHDNSAMRFLLAPGLWLQRLTTREPDDSQLEVAIKAIKAVIPDNPEDDRW